MMSPVQEKRFVHFEWWACAFDSAQWPKSHVAITPSLHMICFASHVTWDDSASLDSCVCVCFSHELCYCRHVVSRHGNLSFTSQHPKHQGTTKAMMSDLQIVKYVIDSDIAPACVRNSTCHCQRQCQSLDCVALPSLRGGPALIWNGSAVVAAHVPIVIDQWHSWKVLLMPA